MHIDPTRKEIEDRWRRWQREREDEGERVDPDDAVREGKEHLRQLIQALKEVVDEAQDPDAVYERRLSERMSREQWRLRLRYEGAPERRALPESALALADDEFFRPHEALRQVLIMEKLNVTLPN